MPIPPGPSRSNGRNHHDDENEVERDRTNSGTPFGAGQRLGRSARLADGLGAPLPRPGTKTAPREGLGGRPI